VPSAASLGGIVPVIWDGRSNGGKLVRCAAKEGRARAAEKESGQGPELVIP